MPSPKLCLFKPRDVHLCPTWRCGWNLTCFWLVPADVLKSLACMRANEDDLIIIIWYCLTFTYLSLTQRRWFQRCNATARWCWRPNQFEWTNLYSCLSRLFSDSTPPRPTSRWVADSLFVHWLWVVKRLSERAYDNAIQYQWNDKCMLSSYFLCHATQD